MSLIRNLLMAIGLMLPIAGHAQQIVATDVTSVANFFLNEGAKPQLDTDKYGDPRIKVRYQGSDFIVYYYGCTDGSDCTSIQFYSGYKTKGRISEAVVNKWNNDKRYLKAYISEAGSARIEQDIYLGTYGMDIDDFRQLVDTWVRLMVKFEVFIDW